MTDSVVVITGASSGLGKETALHFARRGANVVLAARREEPLEAVAEEIRGLGRDALTVVTDVTDATQVDELARRAAARYGRLDTWVNNASVAIYSTFEKLTNEEIRRVMEVNFMGAVHGTRAALEQMRERGGVIINVASVAGKRGLPLLSSYSASKHAVVGFDEAVRAELINEGLPVHLCTVFPPSMDTPLFRHARTHEGKMPRPIPPVYDPAQVADAIVNTAERPQARVVPTTSGQSFVWLNALAPAVLDLALGRFGRRLQLSDARADGVDQDNLYRPQQDGTDVRDGWIARPKPHARDVSLAPLVVGFAAAVLLTRVLATRRRGDTNVTPDEAMEALGHS